MEKANPPAVAAEIGAVTAVWMPETNRYVLARPPADRVAKLIAEGRKTKGIVDFCMTDLGVPKKMAVEIEKSIRQKSLSTTDGKTATEIGMSGPFFDEAKDTPVISKKFYRWYDRVFEVGFSSDASEFVVHPQFAHLETRPQPEPDHQFVVKHLNGRYALQVDRHWVGMWPEEQEHVFSGRFSLKLLEKAFGKTEDQWMGVLHAAGVADGNNGLIFAGDSGTGKSTLAALLMASGYDVLADDFLPIESETGQACSFPAAISVKKDALRLLSPAFPALQRATTYHYPKMGKTVRYLPSRRNGEKKPRKKTCSALVFVDYRPDAGFQLEEMPAEEAFAQLVPDSWIEPSEKNARRFLQWFARLDCWRLTYSDNEMMLKGVKRLFAKGF